MNRGSLFGTNYSLVLSPTWLLLLLLSKHDDHNNDDSGDNKYLLKSSLE